MDPAVRLYLDDPYRLEFEAAVVERRPLPGGGVGVVLDRTCFYPTSGGQPHDTGVLDGEPVLEVLEDADGTVVHRVARAPAATRVQGHVDAERRRDHMQQHSGQHLLSATCVALLQRPTLSFHLGAERCAIDLPGPPLAPEDLLAVERRCNEIVWEARPIRARFEAPEAAADLRRAAPAHAAAVRVVEIEGWDRNACCGTHVARTSEIGLLKILAQERVAGATRLHFVCGTRALAAVDATQRRLDALVRKLTCHPDELGERYDRLADECRTLRKQCEVLAGTLAEARAAGWIAAAERLGDVPLVVEVCDLPGESALRDVVAALVGRGAVALVGRAGERVDLLFARPDALPLDLRPAMQAACAVVGGRGGGAPARVQGGGTRVEALAAALRAARAAVRGQGGGAGAF